MSVYPGNTLTAIAANVTASPAPTRTWAWLRNGTAIPAQTAVSYLVTEADVGASIAARQTETNFLGTASAVSAPAGPVVAYNPATLFTLAQPGIWLDPSDVANLNWRRNLLTWTQNFDNSVWLMLGASGASRTANATTAPDGTNTAYKYAVGTGSGAWYIANYANLGIVSGQAYTFSVYVKADGLNFVFVRPHNNTSSLGSSGFIVSLIDGTITYPSNPLTPVSTGVATSVGNGWWRISATSIANASSASSTGGPGIWPCNGTTFSPATTGPTPANFTGDGTSGLFLWGAQLEFGSVATAYQPITDLNSEIIALFPNATLYQDTAGTTPVTTPGQPVGLALDKSLGLVPGPELVTTPSGVVSAGSYGPGFNVVAGKTYLFSYTISANVGSVSASWRVALVGGQLYAPIVPVGFNGPVTARVTALSSGNLTLTPDNVGTNLAISNVSIRELPGNHATQPTAGSRPIYGINPFGGRRNLLTYTEEFDDAAWTKSLVSVTANSGTAPNGQLTADKIVPNATNDFHYVGRSNSVTSGTAYTSSFYAKADGYGFIRYYDPTTSQNAVYTLSGAGTITDNSGGASTITNVGNGWYRCTKTFTAVSTTQSYFLYPQNVVGMVAYAGDGTSGVLVWGAQLELGSTATPYQSVTDQYNVTEAGVPSVSYLQFDTSKFLVTPTINANTATSDGQPRRNLLTFPAAFDDAVWTKTAATVTANVGVAPDGTLTADAIIPTATTSTHGFGTGITATGISTFTVSAYLKTFGYTNIAFCDTQHTASSSAIVDLQTGAQRNVTGTAGTTTVTAAGDGWYRVSWTFTGYPPSAVNYSTSIRVMPDGTGNNNPFSFSWLANGTSGVLAWGYQMEIGSSASAFQNIGFNTAQVFAGVRKLSDATLGMIAEFSTSVSTNNGSFYVVGPSSNGLPTYAFAVKGTVASVPFASGYAAPITNVITGIGDIAGDNAVLRVNGSQVAQNNGDQGTGNFGNYPLYIGMRAGSSLPFNGQIYSLIVRFGATLPADDIAPTETWVAGKTGISIANNLSPTIFARDETVVLDRFNQTIERRAL